MEVWVLVLGVLHVSFSCFLWVLVSIRLYGDGRLGKKFEDNEDGILA